MYFDLQANIQVFMSELSLTKKNVFLEDKLFQVYFVKIHCDFISLGSIKGSVTHCSLKLKIKIFCTSNHSIYLHSLKLYLLTFLKIR